MKVVVVGGGSVGYYLAKAFLENGHEPTVVEQNKKVSNFIANELDIPVVCGDGTTIEVLESASTQTADALIGVTGKDENNLIACQLAKKLFNVKRVVAKVNNPKNAESLKILGIDIVVNSTNNIVRLFEREVNMSSIKRIVSLNEGEESINEVQIPENYKLNGKRLVEFNFPEDTIIISIVRNKKLIIPRGNTQVLSNDKVMILSTEKALYKVNALLKLEEKE
jgi:trk system potassium uptake protein TrkA